jgi:hypothetical protein
MARCARVARWIFCLLLAAAPALPAFAQYAFYAESPESAALRVLDDYIAAYNARDEAAFVATLHFPHVRIAGDRVRTFAGIGEYMRELQLEKGGWDYSTWTERRVVQSNPSKVHIAARFTRYRAGGIPVGSYDSLYVIVLRNGKWGVLARSSYAP